MLLFFLPLLEFQQVNPYNNGIFNMLSLVTSLLLLLFVYFSWKTTGISAVTKRFANNYNLA